MAERQTKIRHLQIGDLVDLEGDRFADDGQHPEFEFEYQIVHEIEFETPDCICIYFDSVAVGFPPNHTVTVER